MFRLSISLKSREERNERTKHRANMDCDYIALHHVILARKKRIRLENRRTAYKYYVGICLCISRSKDANISVKKEVKNMQEKIKTLCDQVFDDIQNLRESSNYDVEKRLGVEIMALNALSNAYEKTGQKSLRPVKVEKN